MARGEEEHGLSGMIGAVLEDDIDKKFIQLNRTPVKTPSRPVSSNSVIKTEGKNGERSQETKENGDSKTENGTVQLKQQDNAIPVAVVDAPKSPSLHKAYVKSTIDKRLMKITMANEKRRLQMEAARSKVMTNDGRIAKDARMESDNRLLNDGRVPSDSRVSPTNGSPPRYTSIESIGNAFSTSVPSELRNNSLQRSIQRLLNSNAPVSPPRLPSISHSQMNSNSSVSPSPQNQQRLLSNNTIVSSQNRNSSVSPSPQNSNALVSPSQNHLTKNSSVNDKYTRNALASQPIRTSLSSPISNRLSSPYSSTEKKRESLGVSEGGALDLTYSSPPRPYHSMPPIHPIPRHHHNQQVQQQQVQNNINSAVTVPKDSTVQGKQSKGSLEYSLLSNISILDEVDLQLASP